MTMNNGSRFFLIILLSILSPAQVFGNDDNLIGTSVFASSDIPSFTIDEHSQYYPTGLALKWVEGWVIVGFILDEDGSKSDVRILEQSIDSAFAQSVLDMFEEGEVNPFVNGIEPVPGAWNRLKVQFIREGYARDISPQVKRDLDLFYDALKSGDLTTAKSRIRRLGKRKLRLLSWDCWIDIANGDYRRALGDLEQARLHYRRALVLARDHISEDSYRQLLSSDIFVNAQLGHFSAVLDRHRELLEVTPDLPDDDPVNQVVATVRALIESENPITTRGVLLAPCKACGDGAPAFFHKLVRNRMTVADVEGRLDEVKFLCGASIQTVAYAPNTTWPVTQNSGEACWMQLSGEEGTTFNIVELH